MSYCSVNRCEEKRGVGGRDGRHMSLPLKIDQKSPQKKNLHNNEIN